MQPQVTTKSRTIVYVDGFNLYYGALKGSKSKWLDLQTLFTKLLGERHQIIEIKYFTARVSSRDGDLDAPNRQNAYLKALEAYIPNISIYFGHFLTHDVKARVRNPKNGCPNIVTVIETKEKGSDVNLALHILNDAWHDRYDCVVLVSNDSDLAEALKLVKTEHQKKIGYLVPGQSRHPSKVLMRYQDFMKIIRNSALADSQLPNPIPGTNIYKPESW